MSKIEPLYRVLYCSRQTLEVQSDLDLVVRDIISPSALNNRQLGVTGLLITVKGFFIQALEGSRDSVRTTYARISLDRRHHDLRIVTQGPAEARLFADWNMCARTLAPTDRVILDVLDAKGALKPAALTGEGIQRLLINVAAIQRSVLVG